VLPSLFRTGRRCLSSGGQFRIAADAACIGTLHRRSSAKVRSLPSLFLSASKHFKFEERGKRRIHKKPSTAEVRACRPWLEAEIALIRPKIIVCLGATAAQSVFGADYRVTKERGQFVEHPWVPQATSTIHPSAILRAPDEEQRRTEYQRFVADLKKVAAVARALVESPGI
jgi:uracil-DNA glycosylase